MLPAGSLVDMIIPIGGDLGFLLVNLPSPHILYINLNTGQILAVIDTIPASITAFPLLISLQNGILFHDFQSTTYSKPFGNPIKPIFDNLPFGYTIVPTASGNVMAAGPQAGNKSIISFDCTP